MTRLLKSAGDLVRPGQANKTPGATPLYLVWDFIVCRTLRSSESSLNLGTTCASVGLGVGAGNTDVTEMASGLTLIRSSEEESVGSSRGLHNELVKSHALATSGGNTGTGRFGESEGGDLETSGHVENALIVSHGTDNNGGPVVLGVLQVLDHAGEGDWGSHGSRGQQTSEDGSGELGACSAGQESKQLDQKMVVKIVGSGALLVLVLEAAAFDKVDTHSIFC